MESGIVFGISPGTTTISYTVAANSCSAGSVAHFTLTVNPSGNAGVISGPANVCVGSSILLSTSGSSGGTWISGSPAASVNSFGLVTGVAREGQRFTILFQIPAGHHLQLTM